MAMDALARAKGRLIRFARKYPDNTFDQLIEFQPSITKELTNDQLPDLRQIFDGVIESIRDGTYQPKSKGKKKTQSQQQTQPQPQSQPQQQPTVQQPSQDQVNQAVEMCLNEGKCQPLNDIMQEMRGIRESVSGVKQEVANDVHGLLSNIDNKLKGIQNSSQEELKQVKEDLLSKMQQLEQSQSQSVSTSEGSGPEKEASPSEEQTKPESKPEPVAEVEPQPKKEKEGKTAAQLEAEQLSVLQSMRDRINGFEELLQNIAPGNAPSEDKKGESEDKPRHEEASSEPESKGTEKETQDQPKKKGGLFRVASRPDGLGVEGE